MNVFSMYFAYFVINDVDNSHIVSVTGEGPHKITHHHLYVHMYYVRHQMNYCHNTVLSGGGDRVLIQHFSSYYCIPVLYDCYCV